MCPQKGVSPRKLRALDSVPGPDPLLGRNSRSREPAVRRVTALTRLWVVEEVSVRPGPLGFPGRRTGRVIL